MVRFSGGWVGLWVGGSAGDGQIGGGGVCCAKLVVGGPACEWVSKDGSTVGGLAMAVGRCVGCGGWRRLCFDFGGFFFGCDRNNFSGYVFIIIIFLFIRWCWWIWICVSGGYWHYYSRGGCTVVDDDNREVV